MIYRLLADGLVLIHLAFVAFVLAGGLLVLWRPVICWAHLPAAAWGALIEFTGWICPLTPWEVVLRRQAGQAGYTGGFVEHYILPVLYPEGLTTDAQMVLGFLVVAVNVGIYAFVWRRRPRIG
jgi:hypothetical protein